MNTIAKSLLSTACLTMLAVGSAQAGGLERGGYNIDLLFDPSRFASEVTGSYVMPDREIKNARDTNPRDGIGANGRGGGTTTADGAESYWIPRVGLKAGMGPVDCMADYSQPWGVHSKPGRNWVGANSEIETRVNSDNYAGTCSFKMDAGKGQFRLLGGVFYQELDGFKERLVAPIPAAFGTGVGRLDLKADGVGWRIGAAYEIEEIALRASLVYNSEVDLDEIQGSLDLRQIPGAVDPTNPLLGKVTNVFGSATMPQSVEFKLQSGIAPDWLAFGSVKWVDWSQLQTVAFCPVAIKRAGINSCTYNGGFRATSLDLLYRDGWTVSGGIGHKFNDMVSGAVSLAWDRGTTTGLSVQTDTWTVSGGASITPNKNVELRLGALAGIMTSGSVGVVTSGTNTFGTDVAYNFGNDFVGALSASLKVKF